MPFGVGNDSVGQSPGAQQGFQQQLTQLQQQMPQLLERLKDPNYRMQAAQTLAQQMPAPPPDFTTPVGSGTPGQENSVGLPQGVRPPAAGMNQPQLAPDPFAFPGQPPSVSQALSAQQQAAAAFGGQPSPAAVGPQSPVGIAPGAGPGSGGDGSNYLRALMAQRFASGGF